MSTAQNMVAVIHEFRLTAELLRQVDQHLPAASSEHQEHETAITTEIPRWQTFLNRICFLCDRKSGGASVTAIAVARVESRPTLFFAANNGVTRKQFDCLRIILTILRCLAKGDIDAKGAREEICNIAIATCCRKIRNHVNRLRREIALVACLIDNRECKSSRAALYLHRIVIDFEQPKLGGGRSKLVAD